MCGSRPLVCLLTLLIAAGAAAAQTPPRAADSTDAPDELVGLWEAKVRFGPDVSGLLLIDKSDEGFIADISGYRIPVAYADGELTFGLPDGRGSFRGGFDGATGAIEGHWIAAPVLAGGGQRFASRVTLSREADGSWRGEVRPLPDAITFFVPIEADSEGVLTAYLRNPERNAGRFIPVERVERVGDTVRLVGRRSSEGPEETFVEGHYHRDSKTLSLYFENFDATYDFKPAGLDGERQFFPRGENPPPYSYASPPALDDGWPTGTLDAAGIDESAIARLIDEIGAVPMDGIGASQVHALLIARHGRLVLEEYFHGFDRRMAHDTRSAAKSLAAVMIGAAIEAGAPFDVSTELLDAIDPSLFPAEVDPRLAATSVEHLLTMGAGFACDDADPTSPGNENGMQEQDEEPNWHRYSLAVPMVRESGEKSVYCSMKPHLLSAVLSHETGRWLPDLFCDLIAKPLGIQRYHLNLTPTGDFYTGGGAYFEPRDFMKLGQLVLNEGMWEGQRILSRDFVRRMISTQTKIGDRQYGWLWWIEDYPYEAGTVRAVFAGGNGGQIVMAVPELDLVIAFYGGSYSDRALFIPQNVYVPQRILPAVAR
jgi:CubicO group peptidase (beta-lactamase class C family)